MGFVKAMEELPLWLKVILCIPVVHIIWDVYRIVKAVLKKNTVAIVVSIVLMFFTWIMWLVDIIMILVKGQVFTMKD